MGDKYRFSISKRRRVSLWTKMMSKQRVQFNAADLLTMSLSKGPKMPLHTIMGLQVNIAYVLAHFACRLLLSRKSAFSSQNSIRENISLHFLIRKIFTGWLKILRCMWTCDAKQCLFWMSPHGKVSTHRCTWMSPHGKVHGCHHTAKFPLPLYNCQALLAMPRPPKY